jgi:prepilin-type N-terminal cleavage/methylation domain-containing protein
VERALQCSRTVDRGFSLLEVLVATVILSVAIVGLAQLALTAIRTNRAAETTTLTTLIASQKIEQLRALAWAFDVAGGPVSDTSTDTAALPERSSGGTGLQTSESGVLDQNTAGYCDFVDAKGRIVGSGTMPPASAAFVRRWSVQPVPLANDALVVQVWVAPVAMSRSAAGGGHGAVRIVTIKARKAP